MNATQAIEQARSTKLLETETVSCSDNPAMEFLKANAPADVLALIDTAE